MSTLQTVFLFVATFVASRVVIKIRAHEAFLVWLLRKAQGRPAGLLLGIMLGSFLMSLFVPNVITVLAVVPVIEIVLKHSGLDVKQRNRLGTMLVLGLIWSANIGGMGTVVGSGANMYLIVNLEVLGVPGRHAVHFVSWLALGFPLAVVFFAVAWLLLVIAERRTLAMRRLELSLETPPKDGNYRWGLRLCAALLTAWVVLIGAQAIAPQTRQTVHLPFGQLQLLPLYDAVALAVLLLFILATFWRFLRLGDLVQDLPWRGIALAVLVLGLLVGISYSGALQWISGHVRQLLPGWANPVTVVPLFAMVTIFLTEVVSNTAVATAFFPMAYALADSVGISAITLMVAISMASTCAFMTPVATPVNALAFGSVRGVKLSRMAGLGFILNIVGGLLISFYLLWTAAPILGVFE